MKTILLVEDDQFILDIYANEFKKEGYKIDIARSGQEALVKIKNSYPDLLILDIKLPRENNGPLVEGEGWEVLKAVRIDPRTQNVKVVVTSNSNEEDNIDNISDFKVIKYFLKVTSTPEDIVKVAREILK